MNTYGAAHRCRMSRCRSRESLGRLLADPGVQNVNYRENAVAARLKAQDAASAVARVERVLEGERFVIGQARREHDPRSV